MEAKLHHHHVAAHRVCQDSIEELKRRYPVAACCCQQIAPSGNLQSALRRLDSASSYPLTDATMVELTSCRYPASTPLPPRLVASTPVRNSLLATHLMLLLLRLSPALSFALHHISPTSSLVVILTSVYLRICLNPYLTTCGILSDGFARKLDDAAGASFSSRMNHI
jgi:hypothetical protein